MAKVKPKDFLLAKGEKIVLGLAAGGMALFAVMGVSRFTSAESPATKAAQFKTDKERISAAINRDKGEAGVAPLNPAIMGDMRFTAVDPNLFRPHGLPPFETVDTPSLKRDNPAVLGITEAQVDLVRAPVKAYEVLVQGDKISIGLLKGVKIGTLDEKGVKDLLDDGKKKFQRSRGGYNPPAAAQAPVPNPVAPPPPVAPPMGGGRRGEMGGGAQPQPAGERSEKVLYYVSLDDYDKEIAKPDVVPALSVYPVRMVVVHASFPLKEQLEVIRRALRQKDIASVAGEAQFLGFEVERRIISPTGEVYEWQPYDHIGQYVNKINIRKFADQPDDGLLSYFIRYDQMMAMPLPALAANLAIYPPVRLNAIVRGYNKLQEANKPPVTESEMKKKFGGQQDGNPFAPSQGTAAANAIPGGFGIVPVGGGVERRLPGGNMVPPTATPNQSTTNIPSVLPEQEHMLLRFLDVDIRPGFTYQYRVRIKMKNPNFKKDKEVARPDDAKQEILWGPWVTIANPVNVPLDHDTYASDPVAYADRLRKEFKDPKVVELLDNKNGEQPVVQFQTWQERINIDSGKTEPAGYWVVNEVPVNRVEFLGRKQLTPVPMWSSEKIQYILQTLPKYKVKGIPDGKEQPKGLLVDFITDTLVVDYEGGKTRTRVGDRDVTDESDVEIMLLRPDGTAYIRSSAVDRDNPDRKTRDEAWKKWLEEIKAASDKAGTPGGAATPGIFG